MAEYNALETQRLLRQVENGNFKMLPGGELVARLAEQLRAADELVARQDRELQGGGRRYDPSLAPVYALPPRIMPTEGNPTGLPVAGSTVAPLPQLARPSAQVELTPPRQGEPFNSFMATGGVEAPPPIPFKDTPEGVMPSVAPVAPGKKARRIKLK